MATTQNDRIRALSGTLGVKAPVLVATTANITLSGTQTIDGVAVVAEDRVLVKDQTTASENGIYVCQTAAWIRAADMDGDRDVEAGTMVFVSSGTRYANKLFYLTSTNPTIGTDSLSFSELNTMGVYGTNTYGGTSAGAALADGSTYNTLFGYQAGDSITTGDYNTVVGATAGAAITTGVGATLVGYAAGAALTTAVQLTAFGYRAGAAVTTGDWNTFVGYAAGESCTTGVDNTCFGAEAGTDITTGSDNTCVGSSAGFVLTTGSFNVFGGSGAGQSATTATNNTTLGYRAGYGITDGTDNVLIGYNVAALITTGDYHVIIGSGAGAALTTQSESVLIGYQAGAALTSGAGVTAIGHQAGKTISTANAGTFIGYKAGTLATGADNTLIGSSAGAAMTSATKNTVAGAGNVTAMTTSPRQTVIGYGNLYTKTTHQDGNGGNTSDTDGSVVIGNDNAPLWAVGPGIIIGSNNLENQTSAGTNQYPVVIGWNIGSVIGASSGLAATSNLPSVAIGVNMLTNSDLVGGVTSPSLTDDILIGSGTATNYQGHSTGSANIAIGADALACQNSGTRTPHSCVAIGEGALSGATTGHSNIAIGLRAFADMTTGARNVCVGVEAGYHMTTGTDNVIFGYNACAVSAFSGTKNVIIGADTAVAMTATRTGCVIIGYGTTSSADNTLVIDNSNTAAPLIEGSFASDWLRINGGLAVLRTARSTSTSSGTETIVGCTAANITITVPSAGIAISGRTWVIKDESGGAAGGTPITIATEGAETIDGAATVAITSAYGVVRLYSNGTNLFTF